MYITQQSKNPRSPPKDLKSLFAYYANDKIFNIEPLILDDNPSMWPQEQQDNVIFIREMNNSPVWNVALYPVVQNVLAYIHENFFKALEIWQSSEFSTRGPPPNSLYFYKEFMRRELSQKIAG